MRPIGVIESRGERSLGLDNKRSRRTHTSFTWVGVSQLIMHTYGPERWYSGDKVTTMGSAVSCSLSGCALRGPDTGVHSDVSMACYLRYTKTVEGSFNVKINLCQGSWMPRT